MRSRILTVLLAAVGTVAVTTPASAAVIQPGVPYVLVNRNSGKALELWERSTADGGRISRYQDPDGASQQWPPITLGGFTDPIKRGGPDPWLRHHNGYRYLATTTWNSTVTMRRATTLATAPDQVIAWALDASVLKVGGSLYLMATYNAGRLLWAVQLHPAAVQPVDADRIPVAAQLADPVVGAADRRGQRRRRGVRARPQRLLQEPGRHRGLDRLPRQRLGRRRLRHEPLHPGPEVHLERRRHAQFRYAGPARRRPEQPVR